MLGCALGVGSRGGPHEVDERSLENACEVWRASGRPKYAAACGLEDPGCGRERVPPALFDMAEPDFAVPIGSGPPARSAGLARDHDFRLRHTEKRRLPNSQPCDAASGPEMKIKSSACKSLSAQSSHLQITFNGSSKHPEFVRALARIREGSIPAFNPEGRSTPNTSGANAPSGRRTATRAM